MDTRLLTDTGYFERWREVQRDMNVSGRIAWQVVEKELQMQFALRRYLVYNNFRCGKTRWYRRMKQRPELQKLTFYHVQIDM